MRHRSLRHMQVMIFNSQKHTDDYDEVSSYLELNVDYLPSMDIFDRIWEQYVEDNK